jgi:hypothetical protein
VAPEITIDPPKLSARTYLNPLWDKKSTRSESGRFKREILIDPSIFAHGTLPTRKTTDATILLPPAVFRSAGSLAFSFRAKRILSFSKSQPAFENDPLLQ